MAVHLTASCTAWIFIWDMYYVTFQTRVSQNQSSLLAPWPRSLSTGLGAVGHMVGVVGRPLSRTRGVLLW